MRRYQWQNSTVKWARILAVCGVMSVGLGSEAVAQQPAPQESGRVVGNSYASDYFGFTLDLPSGFKPTQLGRDLNSTNPGRPGVYPLLYAQGPTGQFEMNFLLIVALDLAVASPGLKKEILEGAWPMERGHDLKRKGKPREVTVAGRPFVRNDFEMKKRGVVLMAGSKLTTETRGHALVFIFVATDADVVKSLLKPIDSLRWQE